MVAGNVLPQVEWIRWEPVGWVMNGAKSANGAMRYPALRELTRRIDEGAMSKSDVSWVVDQALAEEVKAKGTWGNAWLAMVGAAGKAGLVSDAQLQKLIEQGVETTLVSKPTVRRGRAMRMDFRVNWKLPGAAYKGGMATALKMDEVMLAERFIVDEGQGQVYGASGTSGRGSDEMLDIGKVAKLANGPHELVARTEFRVALVEPWQAKAVTFVKETKTPVKLAEKDAVVETFVVDGSQREGEGAAIQEVMLDIVNGKAVGQIRTKELPGALAMDVVLRRDGKEQVIGQFQRDSGEADYWSSMRWERVAEFPDGVVDVVLRPDADAAQWELKAMPYWGEEIVIKDVPVRSTAARFNMDEKLRRGVEKSIRVSNMKWMKDLLTFEIHVDKPPVTLSYDVIVRAGGKESSARDIQAMASTGGIYYGARCQWKGDVKEVEVVFRPRRQGFDRPASGGLPWGGVVVVKGVKVEVR
jgi:hypothetical protein